MARSRVVIGNKVTGLQSHDGKVGIVIDIKANNVFVIAWNGYDSKFIIH